MPDLTHFDAEGNARMVDVGGKEESRRMARAGARIQMRAATAEQIRGGGIKKGDVLGTARLAGISGSKLTPQLIPLCHVILVDSVEISFEFANSDGAEKANPMAELRVRATVCSTGRTGVEMEALSAVTIAALTVYDMCKSIDREMQITDVHLMEKTGGKSGHFIHGNKSEESGT